MMEAKKLLGLKPITVLEPKLEDDQIEKTLKNGYSWFGGIIPPRSFTIWDHTNIYVPYLIIEVWFRKYTKRWRRCYIFINQDSGHRKGVLDIGNLTYKDIVVPEEEARPFVYNRKALEKEITTYCKLELLAKNYRKFIDWDLEIHDVKEIYRVKRIVRYKINGKLRVQDLFLDNFVLS